MTAEYEGSAPAGRVQSSSSASQQAGTFPNGHLGHLSAAQEEALERFKAALQDKKLWRPGPPPSHDDQTLLRYLRARRWIVDDALAQFKDTEEWRAANNIDTLYRTIELDAYEQSRRLYPQWTGRRDRRGIPLYVFEIRTLDSKTIANYEKQGANSTFSQAKTDGKTPPGLLRLFALYENLTRFNQPFCTQLTDREHPDVPVTMSTNIVDISGVGLKQFWNLKGHMQAASQLATAHYPETLDRIFIIGAPVFFSTVWGWVKRWFDPITVSKIFVLAPHEVKPTLEAFIEPRNIPKKYGGELDYTFGQLGIPDPAWEGVVRWEKGYSSFPSGPLLWEDVPGEDRLACVRLGAENGKLVREVICTLPRTWSPPEKNADESTGTDSSATASTNTAATTINDASEGTQTSEYTLDDATQTDGPAEAIEKLAIDDGDDKAKTPEVTPIPAATAAA
ncbi:CRAL/TRIO domain-containing protein [Trichoderma citrinoviride]|uniref:CRAL/TRIO domain-containing protein n=1 Tax=Trichoderma citrinoviride TaxID=58853 RepID=A0A2T4B6C5_9HYPO|nr:CRAL/TRIO domain-containing protein [Trichoderma citrinoviride]PTB64874.1 CRAL/TRIO domain-containing protein [Trichoderma citrinoviride]